MTNSQKISRLESQLSQYRMLSQTLKENKRALHAASCSSAWKQAAALFSLPFGNDAFGGLASAMGALAATIIFANCTIFIVLAMIFCAIVDVLFLPLFGIFYPFAVIYFWAFKRARIRRFQRRIAEAEREIKKYNVAKIQRELAETQSALHDYIRDYDPNPPVTPAPPVSLPSYATDVTLDLHPGDY